MKLVYSVSTLFGVAVFCLLQVAEAQAPTPSGSAPSPTTGIKLTAAELDTLVAPIALYPDALISHVLPASTAPLDVVLAARYLRQEAGRSDAPGLRVARSDTT